MPGLFSNPSNRNFFLGLGAIIGSAILYNSYASKKQSNKVDEKSTDWQASALGRTNDSKLFGKDRLYDSRNYLKDQKTEPSELIRDTVKDT